ncbi:hypothetical protein AB0I28_15345 [Phytomonospora sp. NPDC050363]|uniref:hypothetical protein n=1 Tax=Phytomonospora sp. NPDC050363 TaxID=3155642 RepID=UPI0033DE537A
MNSTAKILRLRRAVSLTAVMVLAAAIVPLAASTAAQAAFPGDNGKIHYRSTATGTSKLYSMNADGTGSTQLTTGTGDDLFPVASADGQKLAFITNRSGSYQVWTAGADGSNLFQVTNGNPAAGVSDTLPSWSPTGQIAFNDEVDGISVVNADGTGLTGLTAGRSPIFSPDGTKIAFTRFNGKNNLWVMNADGTGQTQLTFAAGTFGMYTPDWSPDGTRLVAQSFEYNGFNRQVRTINADGTGVVDVAPGASSAYFPQWSPDGTKIVYTDGADVISMNSDGTGPTTLATFTAFGQASDWAVGVAPSGADLATTVTDSADPVGLGGAVTYTATVTNNGPAATGVSATITLSGATATIGTVTASQGSCATAAPVVTCNLGGLAVSASATVAITVTPTAAGTVTATATSTSAQVDPNPADNTDAESTTVNAYADIKVDVGAQPHLGILVPYLTYTLKATNNGPQTATTATITASIPAGATATNLSSGCTATPGTVTCTYSAITNGANASKTFRVPLHLLSLGNVTVTGLRTASAPTDTNATNDTDSATCHVLTFVLVTCS